MSRVITYIDGFNLYYGMKSANLRRFYWLDVWELSRQLLRANQTLEQVRYFSSRVAPSPSDPGQSRRQGIYLEALATRPGVACHFGHYLAKQKTCLACRAVWTSYEEKMTDVNIATELIADAYADRFDTAILISADSDLTSPLLKIRALFPAKRLVVAFPPDRFSNNLKKTAHGHFIIAPATLSASQLPNPVVKPDGFALQRPTGWA